MMGLHLLFFSADPEADRAFLRDVLGWPSVEAGPGWLIFKTPPAELAVHPGEAPGGHAEPYLMCDDLEAEIERLEGLGVRVGSVSERGYGLVTAITLPSGASLGLYQPSHPLALDL
jgi:catechol 2,3-dioxygenase-like lactoylglutathione lyase family enzyme